MLGVQQAANQLQAMALKVTVLFKAKRPNVIHIPYDLLCTTKPMGVINTL